MRSASLDHSEQLVLIDMRPPGTTLGLIFSSSSASKTFEQKNWYEWERATRSSGTQGYKVGKRSQMPRLKLSSRPPGSTDNPKII